MKKVNVLLTLCVMFLLEGRISGQDEYMYCLYASVTGILPEEINMRPKLPQRFFTTHFNHLEKSGSDISASCFADTEDAGGENPAIQQFKVAINLFEQWKFEESQKMFSEICETDDSQNLARFYLGLCQLYRGYYGQSARNLSLILKNVKVNHHVVTKDFEDDVYFYLAISCLMLPDSKTMSKNLFQKLNYEGCKYREISSGIIDIL